MKITEGIIEADFLTIPDDTKYWFVRASSRAEYYPDFKINNFIAIGDNEIKIADLSKIEKKFRETNELLREKYKYLFNEKSLENLLDSKEYKELDKSQQAELAEKIKRSSTIASNKTFSFVEDMDIGDYVLVPYKNSSSFLIGIIISDVFDYQIDHEYLGEDLDYSISDYEKKRRVIWLKEIQQAELPEKLMWIQYGQRAIFDITKNADDINPILSTEYIYKGNASIRVNVGTHDKVSSSSWLQYQLVINENAKDKADEIYQKNKVQSVGHTILETAIDNWEAITVVGASLFSEVDFNIHGIKFKTHGPLSFLVPGSKKRRENEQRNIDLDLQIKEENLSSAKIENRIKETKLNSIQLEDKAKEINNQKEIMLLEEIKKRSDLTSRTEEEINVSGISVYKNAEQQEALKNMEISQKSIGNEFSPGMQTVTQNLVKTESEKL